MWSSLIYLRVELMEKPMKEDEASTSFHGTIQAMPTKKGCVPGDPGVAWAKEGKLGNGAVFYIAVKVAEDEGWMIQFWSSKCISKDLYHTSYLLKVWNT